MSGDWGSLILTGPNVFDDIIRRRVQRQAAAECNHEFNLANQALADANATEAALAKTKGSLEAAKPALDARLRAFKVTNLVKRSHVARHALQNKALSVSDPDVARELGLLPNAPIRNLQMVAYRRIGQSRSTMLEELGAMPNLRRGDLDAWAKTAGLRGRSDICAPTRPADLLAALPFVTAVRAGLLLPSDIRGRVPLATGIYDRDMIAAARYRVDSRWLIYFSRDLFHRSLKAPDSTMGSVLNLDKWMPALNSALHELAAESGGNLSVHQLLQPFLGGVLDDGEKVQCIPIQEFSSPLTNMDDPRGVGISRVAPGMTHRPAGYVYASIPGAVYLLLREVASGAPVPKFVPQLEAWPSGPGEEIRPLLRAKRHGDLRKLQVI